MSRTTRLYLNDILKAADKIARFVELLDVETFKADELRSDSVLYNLMIIGEAVKSLPNRKGYAGAILPVSETAWCIIISEPTLILCGKL